MLMAVPEHMELRIVGRMVDVESIASGTAIRKRRRLWKLYGIRTMEKAEGDCNR